MGSIYPFSPSDAGSRRSRKSAPVPPLRNQAATAKSVGVRPEGCEAYGAWWGARRRRKSSAQTSLQSEQPRSTAMMARFGPEFAFKKNVPLRERESEQKTSG